MSRWVTMRSVKEARGPGKVELASHTDEAWVRVTVDVDPSEQVLMIDLDKAGVEELRNALEDWLNRA